MADFFLLIFSLIQIGKNSNFSLFQTQISTKLLKSRIENVLIYRIDALSNVRTQKYELYDKNYFLLGSKGFLIKLLSIRLLFAMQLQAFKCTFSECNFNFILFGDFFWNFQNFASLRRFEPTDLIGGALNNQQCVIGPKICYFSDLALVYIRKLKTCGNH